jgi:hypothetical protein
MDHMPYSVCAPQKKYYTTVYFWSCWDKWPNQLKVIVVQVLEKVVSFYGSQMARSPLAL